MQLCHVCGPVFTPGPEISVEKGNTKKKKKKKNSDSGSGPTWWDQRFRISNRLPDCNLVVSPLKTLPESHC